MGLNGTVMHVRAGGEIEARLPEAIVTYFASQEIPLVASSPLLHDEWQSDRRRFGLAIAPSIDGWATIADTERAPSADLARALAERLATPVVVSAVYEICDPPEGGITVFGAPMAEEYKGLYWDRWFPYRDLARPELRGLVPFPFDPTRIVFLTFRGVRAAAHFEDTSGVTTDDDPPF